MFSRTSVKTSKNQQGLALLVFIIVVVLAFATYALSGLSINQVKNDNKLQTRIALKNAKDALIAYAVTHSDRSGYEGEMGYFPCPDWFSGTLEEGGSDGNCGNAQTSTIGYFPWVSVDTPIFSDNSGSCLWYAVSGSYKKPNSSISMINEDSSGLFQIMDGNNEIMIGNSPEDRIVAIIFAPGEPLTNQTRTFDNSSFCGKDYGNVSEYLEGNGTSNNGVFDGDPDAIDQFIHATTTSESEVTPYNDQFITVTRNEIWKAILGRSDFIEKMENLTQALAMCLASYANLPANTSRRLPWPVKTDLNGADYRSNDKYKDEDGATIGYSGRFPFDVSNSNSAISATLLNSEIFDMADCNALAVGSGTTAATANLLDPSDPGPPSIPATEYRKLWNNWKDHFFYTLSKGYEPSNTGAATCATSGACITINGNEYAGAVIFSGKRLLDAGGNDTLRSDKSIVTDYLEDSKGAVFGAEATNKTGVESYIYTEPQTDAINDIMYCIQDQVAGIPLVVAECS
ncbi:MAG: hypothetical protein RQ936_05870 [Gammaproteobacteria bacterium]|nr:hypothetical protein [Gammaproteobacteria bacterium]